jgi:flagellar biosynthesis anti-sigma factor FlgM
MKISGRKSVGRSTSSKGATGKRSGGAESDKTSKGESSGPSVGVSISGASQVVSSARAAITAMSDVRVGRVQEIRLAVDEGSYQVESRVLAKRMVDEAIRESAHRGNSRRT